MSTNATLRMISAYYQDAEAPRFLSGMFRSPAENFFDSQTVEIDVVRGEEDVATVVQGVENGWRLNSADIFTNKQFTPPAFKEAMVFNSFDLLKRPPGVDPFQDAGYRAQLITMVFRGMRQLERKIQRAIELQASQILQTGTVTFENSAGATLDSVDYFPKASHFFAAGNAWGGGSDTPLADIELLATRIRTNGLTRPDTIIMGDAAFRAFVTNADVRNYFDNRRYNFGNITPVGRGEGGTYQGEVSIGNYRYSIWTYDGRYKDISSGVSTPYITSDFCVVMSSGARLDALFGNIPNIGKLLGGPNTQLLPELPRRFNSPSLGMDLHTNVWITPDGEQLLGGVASRPLLAPTAIDSFGAIDTGAT